MTQPTDNDPIRERFRELRAGVEGSGRVPDFHGMMEKARQDAAATPELRVLPSDAPRAADGGAAVPPGERQLRRRRALLAGGWASAALAAAVAALMLTSGEGGGNDEFERLVAAYASDVSGGAWRSPTSGLLEVPGSELLRSVPSLGGSMGGIGSVGATGGTGAVGTPGAPGPPGAREPL